MKGCVVLWNEDEQNKILSWWTAFQPMEIGKGASRSGWRAELRRAVQPADILLCSGFRSLYFDLAGTRWIKEENLLGIAGVAGVIAHIEVNDDGHTFAEQCALPIEGRDSPRVSELRFSQLQKSRSFDELFMRMRRAIQLLRKKTNVVSVADSVLHWFRERELGDVYTKPRDRILVRWGLDYFQQLSTAEKIKNP